MIEDDQTVEEMRSRDVPAPRSFMTAAELRVIRFQTLRVTQGKLAEQLIKPTTGQPITAGLISRWEAGVRPVPLWAARRIRDLAEAARRYDAKKG
jgi:hypothetical protein